MLEKYCDEENLKFDFIDSIGRYHFHELDDNVKIIKEQNFIQKMINNNIPENHMKILLDCYRE